jgi:hypothetical protein
MLTTMIKKVEGFLSSYEFHASATVISKFHMNIIHQFPFSFTGDSLYVWLSIGLRK